MEEECDAHRRVSDVSAFSGGGYMGCRVLIRHVFIVFSWLRLIFVLGEGELLFRFLVYLYTLCT